VLVSSLPEVKFSLGRQPMISRVCSAGYGGVVVNSSRSNEQQQQVHRSYKSRLGDLDGMVNGCAGKLLTHRYGQSVKICKGRR